MVVQYVKVAGRWVYLYRRFFTCALEHRTHPSEVGTGLPRILDELLPAACHSTEQYANNPAEPDQAGSRPDCDPMRGLTRLRSAQVISAGHAFVQNLRRGHDELGVDAHPRPRLSAAFAELVLAI